MNSSIYFPAEWVKQQGVICTWPHKNTDWADDLSMVEPVYRELVLAIAQFEAVYINCRDASHQTHIEQILALDVATPHPIIFCQLPFDDTWVRDYGPLTVFREHRAQWLDFRFNGWGGKFSAHHDDKNTAQLHTLHFSQVALKTFPIILEGGAIESDGLGTILTSPCIFTTTRNPRLSRAEMTQMLHDNFGMKKLWVIENGYLAGDDTDGHIDMLARFCTKNIIAYTACEEPSDEHYESLKKMEMELKAGKTFNGEPYELIPLPIPAAIFDEDGERLPASYANFLIINGAVLVPIYDDPMDKIVLTRLQKVFHDRKVIGIDCRALIRQHGSLHCATMQLPTT